MHYSVQRWKSSDVDDSNQQVGRQKKKIKKWGAQIFSLAGWDKASTHMHSEICSPAEIWE